MASSLNASYEVARPATLWFGLLGGPIAWTMHLMIAYVLGEFGCLTSFGQLDWLGVSLVVWAVFALTALTVITGGLALAAALRARRRLANHPASVPRNAQLATARAGVYTSAYSIAVILVETVPVFYYLEC